MLPKFVVLSHEALFQEIGGEGVILDLASSTYFGLDKVGLRFWQLIQADPAVSAARDSLLAEYEIDGPQLEQDLENLIEQLVGAGLAKCE